MPQLSHSKKMICKFDDIEIIEDLLNKMRHASYSKRCMPCEKKATAQIAHLVFAETQANTEKTKRAIF